MPTTSSGPFSPPPAAPGPLAATLIYLGVTLLFTWPLVLGLARDFPADLGDSLLNAWILAWDADHLRRFFTGDFGAFAGFWNANIFHPERLTLAYSEHLFAQAVQIAPVYALTGNIILAYNLLFLSTFVLSGLGAYLLVRELTGSARAGLVAGLIYAFAPYRVPQFTHLQVLSSQWMPFALFGLRRYFVSRRPRALAGAGAALVAQNLSNGYFLLFFAPVVVIYVLYEMSMRGLLKEVRVWLALSATAAGVAALTVPFLLPYLELRSLGFGPRALNEVKGYSADVYGYWTSPAESHLWGDRIRAFPRAEGELFPTLSALFLAGVALVASSSAGWRAARARRLAPPGLAPLVVLLLAATAVYALIVLVIFTGHGFSRLGPLPISARDLTRNTGVLAALAGLVVAVSPRVRAWAARWLGTPAAFALVLAGVALVLSLGPEIRSAGRVISETGPYLFLYDHVPGFDGLRVPARYAMVVVLFLAVAAGCGAAALEGRYRRGGAIALVLGVAAVGEACAAPIRINETAAEGRYAAPAPRVYTGDRVPPVYRYLSTLPSQRTVIVEFPLGEWGYELRYVFYSTSHWHPLLNGYSGHFPMSYNANASSLRNPLDSPAEAWDALMRSGATHAIVHGQYFKDDEGDRIAGWLEANGARHVAEFDGDRVLVLR